MNLTFRMLQHTSSKVTVTQTTIKESNDNEKVNENKQTWLSLLKKYKWLVEKKFLTAAEIQAMRELN